MRMFWKICCRCEGAGKVDHPAFSNGITSSEWTEWDQDDRENYMRGTYDVRCEACKGSGKIQVPDVRSATFAEKRVLVEQRRDERESAECDAMQAAERRMGA